MSRPVAPPVAPPVGRRSRGRRIAVVIWLVVFLLIAGVTAWRAIDYSSRPQDQRVPAAGGTVTITEPGEYSVYADSGSQYGNYGSVSSVTGPSGAPAVLESPAFSENYTAGGRAGIRVATFTASEPGAYTLVGAAEGAAPGDQLVVGTRTVGAMLSIVFGAVATGVVLLLGLIGGLVVLLAGRRRVPPPGPPGPWGPGGPPPAGWTPQQGGWPSRPGGPPPAGIDPAAGRHRTVRTRPGPDRDRAVGGRAWARRPRPGLIPGGEFRRHGGRGHRGRVDDTIVGERADDARSADGPAPGG